MSNSTTTLAAKSRTRQASARKEASNNAFAAIMQGDTSFELKHYADGFTAAQLTELCKSRKWGGYSGLKKDQLVEHVLSGGVAYAKGSAARKELPKAKVSQLTKDVKALNIPGTSSLNAAGKKFVLENHCKPTLKDNTFKAGTADWMKQICREFGIAKFSGKKKAELMDLILASGNKEAISVLENGI